MDRKGVAEAARAHLAKLVIGDLGGKVTIELVAREDRKRRIAGIAFTPAAGNGVGAAPAVVRQAYGRAEVRPFDLGRRRGRENRLSASGERCEGEQREEEFFLHGGPRNASKGRRRLSCLVRMDYAANGVAHSATASFGRMMLTSVGRHLHGSDEWPSRC